MANNNVNLDWIDAILFSFGFVGYIGLLIWAQSTFGFEIPDDSTAVQGEAVWDSFWFGLLETKSLWPPKPATPAHGSRLAVSLTVGSLQHYGWHIQLVVHCWELPAND